LKLKEKPQKWGPLDTFLGWEAVKKKKTRRTDPPTLGRSQNEGDCGGPWGRKAGPTLPNIKAVANMNLLSTGDFKESKQDSKHSRGGRINSRAPKSALHTSVGGQMACEIPHAIKVPGRRFFERSPVGGPGVKSLSGEANQSKKATKT